MQTPSISANIYVNRFLGRASISPAPLIPGHLLSKCLLQAFLGCHQLLQISNFFQACPSFISLKLNEWSLFLVDMFGVSTAVGDVIVKCFVFILCPTPIRVTLLPFWLGLCRETHCTTCCHLPTMWSWGVSPSHSVLDCCIRTSQQPFRLMSLLPTKVRGRMPQWRNVICSGLFSLNATEHNR